jgi:NAD(P)H dehydrogenase (quinone)
MERMAQAVAEGVREAGAEAEIKRVPELVSEDVAKKSGYKLDQKAPIATVAELPNYDAIIFGSGTRFGVVTSQMRNFLDQTGPLWMKGALVGKVGSVFTGSGTQHGGQESTILTMIPTLLHHGMIVVELPYSFQGQMISDEITGYSPYGASTITKPDGSIARAQRRAARTRFYFHLSPLEREVKARHENGILFVIASATQWSEAIQSKASRWIASSLTLLAMTKQK